ncbi:diphthine synthase [Candidatus Woesearchaeota archaeon]|nr:diphthine synthase [Candidatus Woesearchaeota archaeon]
MLNIISLGLFDKKDISVKGLEICKKSDKLYLEKYTNYFDSDAKELSIFFGKEVNEVKRTDLENNSRKIIEEAKKEDVCVLVPGDCFSATTHISLLIEAKKEGVKVNIIHGSSVLTAVGETGLSLYNFGKITTIPFNNKNIVSPIEVLKNNQKLGMHTLFLLDVRDEKYMTINEGLKYLLDKGVSEDNFCVGCAGLGSENKEIKSGKIKELIKHKFNAYPQCLVIPGKLHFNEEEALSLFNFK